MIVKAWVLTHIGMKVQMENFVVQLLQMTVMWAYNKLKNQYLVSYSVLDLSYIQQFSNIICVKGSSLQLFKKGKLCKRGF